MADNDDSTNDNTPGAKAGELPSQLLHLVFGGELDDIEGVRFSDLASLDIVGVYPNYRTAYDAWKSKAQSTVDNARMRYFIVHLHRLLDPETSPAPGGR
jgi:Domain of unknown function (DUF4170)